MQQRIDHLENLVKTLTVQNQELSQSHPPNDELWNHNSLGSTTKSNVLAGTQDALNMPTSTGTTLINRGQSVYKSVNDWSNLLQEVRYYSFDLLLSTPHFAVFKYGMLRSYVLCRKIQQNRDSLLI